MEKSRPTLGMESEVLPPPYSSSAPPQECGLRPPVLASAPYPVTPDSEQAVHNQPIIPMSMPPPYYYYNNMQMGTTGSGVPLSIHNPAYPPIYNPAVTVPQERIRGGSGRNCLSSICVILLVIVIMIIMGISIDYYVKEVF